MHSNIVKSDGQWKRIQSQNVLATYRNSANRPIRFANRTDAMRNAPKRGFDSRRAA
jgi:hypothetical protein